MLNVNKHMDINVTRAGNEAVVAVTLRPGAKYGFYWPEGTTKPKVAMRNKNK